MTNEEAIRIITALITKVKSPRVKKLRGKVSKRSIGLRKTFKRPTTNATSKAVVKPATLTPGKRYAAANTATEVINHLIRSPISLV